jgi:hypothetical protein
MVLFLSLPHCSGREHPPARSNNKPASPEAWRVNVLRTERSVSLHRPPGLRGLLQMAENDVRELAHGCFLSRRTLYTRDVAHVTLIGERHGRLRLEQEAP